MSKAKKTPGAVLQTLISEYNINPFLLSQKINLGYSTIRNILFDNASVSVTTALRLAKFFGQTPEFWLDLQRAADLEEAAEDSSLQKELSKIKKAVKIEVKKPPKKSMAKARKKNTLSDRRKKAAKTPGHKNVSRKKKR